MILARVGAQILPRTRLAGEERRAKPRERCQKKYLVALK